MDVNGQGFCNKLFASLTWCMLIKTGPICRPSVEFDVPRRVTYRLFQHLKFSTVKYKLNFSECVLQNYGDFLDDRVVFDANSRFRNNTYFQI